MFPEVFVENTEGDYYIVCRDSECFFSRSKPSRNYTRYYGHILYEDVIEKALDLVGAYLKKSVVVIPKYCSDSRELEALCVDKDTSVCLMEIKGANPIVFVNEGDEIGERDKIAYIITGKSEVRVYKSVCEGIVFLVVNIPWERPEKYIIVVVGRNDVRRITVKRDQGDSL